MTQQDWLNMTLAAKGTKKMNATDENRQEIMMVKEAHARLVSTLGSVDAIRLQSAIRSEGADLDAGEAGTPAVLLIRQITRKIYFDRTNFANSGGREYIWIFALRDAAETARKNAPERLSKYLSGEEACHWLRRAQREVDEVLAVYAATK